MTIVYQLFREIQPRFALKKWQALGLALWVVGIVQAQSCRASKIAEQMGEMGEFESVERRLRRWISNERINVAAGCQGLMQWIWSGYDGQWIELLVDETKIGARIGCMMVAVAYEKRAIPLVWRVYKANSKRGYPKERQVGIIMALLEQVYATIPAHKRVVVMADRGIGHSSNLIKALEAAGYEYLLRVKSDATFTDINGQRCVLKSMIQPNHRRFQAGFIFLSKRQCAINLMAVWTPQQKEPWFLISPRRTIIPMDWYGHRMWHEECFRDLKSGGWHWNESLLVDPQHANRLLLALSLAYAWMLTQGTLVVHADPDLQRRIDPRKTPKYSIFRKGFRYFMRFYRTDISRIYFGLFFAPCQLLC